MSAAILGQQRLTKRQRQVLTKMRDENEELVYSRGIGYVGLERVGRSVVFGLLRLMALRGDPYSKLGDFERYTISETGRNLLKGEAGT